MRHVCSNGRSCRERIHSPRVASTPNRFGVIRLNSTIPVCAASEQFSEYQKPVQNPYGLLPRPPQTQAAHFKRLYRK